MPRTSGASKANTATIAIPEAIRLLTDQYGPFPEEPRLDPAHELVFTILSQHTSDINSERAFRSLMGRFGSLHAVARAGVDEIESAISVGGLAKVKAPRIRDILTRVLELNQGSLDLSFLAEMPLEEAKAWLRQLPGIGPKSAGIILNFSLGMPAMAVDTHIFRVSQRLGLIGAKVNADRAHDLLEAAVEPDQVFAFHLALISHGRQTCKAQRPRCEDCVINFGCPSRGLITVPAAVPSRESSSRESSSRKSSSRKSSSAEASKGAPRQSQQRRGKPTRLPHTPQTAEQTK
jgi:endonuclease-3